MIFVSISVYLLIISCLFLVFRSFRSGLICFRKFLVRSILHIDVILWLCCRETNDRMSKEEEKVSFGTKPKIVFFCLWFVLVIMPPSALEHLTRLNINYPMLFKLANKKTNRVTHCGVLEFVADEGKVYLPLWVC